jgi:hypothetical protein
MPNLAKSLKCSRISSNSFTAAWTGLANIQHYVQDSRIDILHKKAEAF